MNTWAYHVRVNDLRYAMNSPLIILVKRQNNSPHRPVVNTFVTQYYLNELAAVLYQTYSGDQQPLRTYHPPTCINSYRSTDGNNHRHLVIINVNYAH